MAQTLEEIPKSLSCHHCHCHHCRCHHCRSTCEDVFIIRKCYCIPLDDYLWKKHHKSCPEPVDPTPKMIHTREVVSADNLPKQKSSKRICPSCNFRVVEERMTEEETIVYTPAPEVSSATPSADPSSSRWPSAKNSSNSSKTYDMEESLLQWFDRRVEYEMEERRLYSLDEPMMYLNTFRINDEKPLETTRQQKQMQHSSTHGMDIPKRMRPRITDAFVREAADKLFRAEAMCQFEKAVRAAEIATSKVPPEKAEEAALKGAEGYTRKVVQVVRETIPGERPIELIGYVGLTMPQ